MKRAVDDLRERLAALEHDQWWSWSLVIGKSEDISADRLKSWKRCWKLYDKLSEKQKESDRLWADKVLKIIGEHSAKDLLPQIQVHPGKVDAKQAGHVADMLMELNKKRMHQALKDYKYAVRGGVREFISIDDAHKIIEGVTK